MDINEAMAAVIRGEMGAQRVTWRELAARSGIPERTLARLLKPERDMNLDHLFAIAEALGRPAGDLMREAEDRRDRSK